MGLKSLLCASALAAGSALDLTMQQIKELYTPTPAGRMLKQCVYSDLPSGTVMERTANGGRFTYPDGTTKVDN
jgi:hypothetical protein